MNYPLKALSGAAMLFALANSAQAVTIGFEGFAAGTIIDDEYAPLLTISTVNLGGGQDHAVIFDTDNPTGGDTDLGASFSGPITDPGNVLIIQENSPCNALSCDVPDDEGSRPAGDITFVFSSIVTLGSIDVFDIDNALEIGSIEAFSDAGATTLIGTFAVPITGDNGSGQIDFGSLTGVQSIIVHMGGSGALDNLSFTVVPLPAAAWLFISGVFGLVAVSRRKLTS